MIYKSQFSEKLIPKAPAYWISPIGRVLPIFDDDKHIHQIIKNPKAFGMNTEQIQKFYDLENETLGDEGRARESIIKDLLLQGWLRIRYYARNDTYTLNVSRLNGRNKNFIYNWAKAMAEQGRKYSLVKIDLINKVISSSVEGIVNEALLNEAKQTNQLKVVMDVMSLPEWSYKK